MFGKITKRHVARSFHKAKNFLGHAYNQTKGFLNHVDHGVQTFKQIYDVVSPLVSKYANNHSDKINNNVNRVIGGYENIRNKVIEGDQDIQKVKHRFKNI